MFMNILCAMHMMTTVPSMIWKCMKKYENVWKIYEWKMWVLYVYEYIVCDEHDDCSALQSGRVLPPLLFWAIICLPVQIIQLKCSSCWGDGKQFWCIMIKKAITLSPLRNQRSANKWLVVRSLTFSFVKIIKRLLFLPGYHITLHHTTGSQTTHYRQVHRLTKSSTLLSAPFLASRIYTSPPIIENLLIYFYRKRVRSLGMLVSNWLTN